MDKADSTASGYQLLVLSAWFTVVSVAAWYGYVSYSAPESTAGLSVLLTFLAGCLIVLWLVRIKVSGFKLDVVRTWCLLLAGWGVYQLMVPGRDFDPAFLAVCLTAAMLVSAGTSVVLAVRAKLREE